MEISPRLRDAISRRGDTSELRKIALSEGMRTLRDSARELVLDGVTSVAEMQRIAAENSEQGDEMT